MFEFDVSKLTLEQKARLVRGSGQWHTQNVGDLPVIMMCDGPHGLRKQADKNNGINDSVRATCFPTACAVASSWNTENASKMADAIACEAISENVNVVLGPGINIKRNPLCGRNFEYYSEDPHIAGKMSTAFVNAMQNRNIGCSLKHFAVNSQESFRMTVDTLVDERALREIYLSAFEYTVKNAQPFTVMAAYNKVNGTSCAQNKYLLTDILRNEWGFKGLVVSDWTASYNLLEALQAGCDLEMPDNRGYHEKQLIRAVKNGNFDEQYLDRAVSNVAQLTRRTGAFQSRIPFTFDEHHALAREIENDSAVLLKNDGGLLPLSQDKKVLVVGGLATNVRYQGGGSSHVNTDNAPSFVDVLKKENIDFDFEQGYNVKGDEAVPELEESAVEKAKNAETVLFFGGLTDDFEGEGYDRKHLNVPSCQTSLLEKILEVNQNVVFVAFGGSPFVIPFVDKLKSILLMYLGGEAVMESAFDLLFGKVSPSGRLAETFPLALSDVPSYNYFANKNNSVELRESIFVGYRYYNTFDKEVCFPFGYGLSYTKFDYSNMTIEPGSDGGCTVKVTVQNVGKTDGSEVVELFVDNADVGIMRPKRELRAFTKVHLSVGEKKTVSLTLDERAFSYYDTMRKRFVVANGTYGISICKNVNETLLQSFVEVAFGENVFGNDRLLYGSYFEQSEDTFTVSDSEFYRLICSEPVSEEPTPRGKYTMESTLGQMATNVKLVRKVLGVANKITIKRFGSDTPEAQMILHGATETPLISLYPMSNVSVKYFKFLLYHANKKPLKALLALFGKYDFD